ncbi:MAG: hypothetical protein ABWK01_07635 [Infirmifilum sp.]
MDFDELKLPMEDEVKIVRKELGIHEDHIVLTTYAGVFGEEFSTLKGANYLASIWREVRNIKNTTLLIIVTVLNRNMAKAFGSEE